MRWHFALLATLVLGCSAVAPPHGPTPLPTHTPTATSAAGALRTAMPTAESGRWVVDTEGSSVVQVRDMTGLVTDVLRLRSTRLDHDAAVLALPAQKMLNVSWSGGACDLSTLWIQGDASQMALQIDIRQGAATPPGTECPASEHLHGVSLSVSQPVDQAAVRIDAGQADAGNVFMVPWSQEHFGDIVVNVRDETRLVVGARKLRQPVAGAAWPTSAAQARPEDRQVDVRWVGGVCRFGPTVTLIGDAKDLVITIDPTAGGELPPGIGCADLGAFYGVTLDLNTPVEQPAIEVKSFR